MKLTEINIYPIKSMGSLSLKEAKVLKAGLEFDRRWLLLDEKGKFMTQRNMPEMALIKFEAKENGFEAFFKNDLNDRVFIPFATPADAEKITAQVWNDKVQAYLMDGSINEWYSHIFKKKCSLVRIVENDVRKNTEGKPDKISSFADSTPFSIAGEKSLEDLNARLVSPVPMSRFRFNFVFSNGTAYEEDNWGRFKIGSIYFKKHEKCGRCKVVTIDQNTGIKMDEEPLATLSKYRMEDRQINFGIRAYVKEEFENKVVKVGDTIEKIT